MDAHKHCDIEKKYGKAFEEALAFYGIKPRQEYAANDSDIGSLLKELAIYKASEKASETGKSFTEWKQGEQNSEKSQGSSKSDRAPAERLDPDLAAAISETGAAAVLNDKTLVRINERAKDIARTELVVERVLVARHRAMLSQRGDPAIRLVDEMLEQAHHAPYEALEVEIREFREDVVEKLPPPRTFFSNLLPRSPEEKKGPWPDRKRMAGTDKDK